METPKSTSTMPGLSAAGAGAHCFKPLLAVITFLAIRGHRPSLATLTGISLLARWRDVIPRNVALVTVILGAAAGPASAETLPALGGYGGAVIYNSESVSLLPNTASAGVSIDFNGDGIGRWILQT
jgi:hypothetical protein